MSRRLGRRSGEARSRQEDRSRGGPRLAAWVVAVGSAIGIAALAALFILRLSSAPDARELIALWSGPAGVAVIQETGDEISYSGSWLTDRNVDHLGGAALGAVVPGSKATLEFSGTGIAWVGPIGPTGGLADVYVDGSLAAIVDARNAFVLPARVLFQRSWATAGSHQIVVEAAGHAGLPAVDAFVVHLDPSTPKPTAAPTATPAPAGTSVRVTSIPALLSALADDAVTQITVADGTYRVSPASSQASNSLWIGSRFAGRTRAVTIRAETTGGVIFDGGGSNSFGGITFVAGAHDQTWEGFTWANGTPTGPSGQGSGTGVVVFGGYAGQAAPHHITLRDSTVRPTAGSYIGGHAVYFSWAASPGAHDIVLDGLTVDDPRGLITAALHFYHSDAANLNASRVTVRNLRVAGTTQAVMIWDPTVHDVLIEDSVVTGAKQTAVSYEEGSAITLRRVTSTGSGVVGFYSSLGPNPPGVTFIDTSLH